MTTTRIEEVVNESFIGFSPKVKGLDGDILDELTDDIRKALTEAHQAGIDEAVECLYEVDVDKTPTIQDEAWGNQFSSKTEAFWYGQEQYRKDILQELMALKEGDKRTL